MLHPCFLRAEPPCVQLAQQLSEGRGGSTYLPGICERTKLLVLYASGARSCMSRRPDVSSRAPDQSGSAWSTGPWSAT